ncbi:60S ribosomal protein L28 [Massariosphaeria phaeospora]|uniref:60S ribosomal protein L28 n=1 Tax=Massariosphaeria phaeospora TaxID=100035 RepID=A0A7C8I1G1_9PLEO|nr:60S ribosomal protein L28 [Massariosphaeria phaeospora]
MATLSSDLIWEITRNTSSNLVKRKTGGGYAFSRDPLNLTNKYNRRNEGLVNNKAIGIAPGQDGGVTLITKKNDKAHSPASHTHSSTFPNSRSTRKIYSSIIGSTANRNYRADLRKDAVARASALRKSQKPVKESKVSKPRGAKAKATEEST